MSSYNQRVKEAKMLRIDNARLMYERDQLRKQLERETASQHDIFIARLQATIITAVGFVVILLIGSMV